MKQLTLLVAVLAIVLSPVVAWGEVAVLAAVEPGDDLPDLSGWSTVSLNTSDTAGPSSSASWEVTSASASGYISFSFDAVDATDMPYINFYVNVEGATELDAGVSMYPFGGGGYMDCEGCVDYPDAGTADWTYMSVDRSDMTKQGMDWSVFDGLELGGGSLVGTILYDHITVSTTPEEGELGEAEPEAALVFISGPLLVTAGQEVTLVGNVVGGEVVEDCGWTLDGGAIGGSGDELDLGAVDAGDEGVYVYECTVDDEATPSDDFELQIVDAVPLAGGLALGLLAGACALAGAVVTIRRKK